MSRHFDPSNMKPVRPRRSLIRPWFTIVTLVLACTLLQACSTLRLAYSQAPLLAQWRIDSYLDLTGEQASRLRADLEGLHRWHQQVQLPRQLAVLGSIRRQLSGDLSAADACSAFETFSADARELLARAEPTLVWLALNLEPGQINHLERYLAKQRAEAVPEEAAREARYGLWLSRSQTLYGNLDAPQRAALRAALDAESSDLASVRAWRLTRDQDMVKTLRALQSQKSSAPQARAMLGDWIDRLQRPVDPAHLALVSHLRTDGCRVFARLHNTTTVAQRQGAARNLAAYAADLSPMVLASVPSPLP